MEIRYCIKCVFPETKPDLTIDQDGICSACRSVDEKFDQIDWGSRKKDFEKIINNYK